MSAVVQQQPATRWGSSPYSRMSSVEELDSSLTLLSRHIVLAKNLPMTPPGTPSAVPGVEEINSFEYGSPVCTPIQKIPPNTPVTPFCRPLNIVTDGRADSFDLRPSGNNGTLQAPNVAAIDNKIEQAMVSLKPI
ncbi:unnamed protein product [Auanema sp. JU1783]|nr:unnamed protein product [Auanema sp. JU1783]